jgi:hypothetical protein
MITVSTKKMSNGKWVCYATVDGYDHSFEGKSFLEVRSMMIKFLRSRGKENYAVWQESVIIPKREYNKKENVIGYTKSRIDNNPFG